MAIPLDHDQTTPKGSTFQRITEWEKHSTNFIITTAVTLGILCSTVKFL